MKALKCKTLGGIHMQSTAAMELCAYIYTLALCIYCACAYECLSRPSPVSRLFHAGCTSTEASFDPPVALHVAAAFRLSRNCAKAADSELQFICILAFSRHNFFTEGFFENPRVKIQEKPKRDP